LEVVMIRTTLLLFVLSASAAIAEVRIEAAPSAGIGTPVEVTVSGTTNPLDFVTIVPKNSQEGAYGGYEYVNQPGVFKLTAPAEPGDYEIRVLAADGPYPTLAKRPLRVEAVTASLEAPAQVSAGVELKVQWTGPDNPRDYVAIGNGERPYITYAYTSAGNPITLTAPDEPGAYELRYFLGEGDTVIGTRPIAVGGVTATVSGPAETAAGSTFPVRWEGPGNPLDYVTIVAKGAREGESDNYAYTKSGNPVSLLAPLEAGDYELRYSTGQSNATLARSPIRVTEGKESPGFVTVTVASAASAVSSGNAIEIILDASGSMLQRIGSDRRIDIARQTLTKLVSADIPAGTPFAFRVFGREVDSCQTDLEIPLGPLDRAAVSARIGKLEAKNGAKTPIGASLDKVAEDLRSVRGERLVILLTDGEETCGGDPAAAIEQLKKAGVALRVNIVGFAIDDPRLAATFRHWSDAGGGLYFDASDAAGLGKALSQATQAGVELVDGDGKVVAQGLAGETPLTAMPGAYTVRLKGQSGKSQPVTIRSKETTAVRF
jgi:von Willebrand factor type A domain-containing protein